MKSAYELAMERLAQSSGELKPLTDEQKQLFGIEKLKLILMENRPRLILTLTDTSTEAMTVIAIDTYDSYVSCNSSLTTTLTQALTIAKSTVPHSFPTIPTVPRNQK